MDTFNNNLSNTELSDNIQDFMNNVLSMFLCIDEKSISPEMRDKFNQRFVEASKATQDRYKRLQTKY